MMDKPGVPQKVLQAAVTALCQKVPCMACLLEIETTTRGTVSGVPGGEKILRETKALKVLLLSESRNAVAHSKQASTVAMVACFFI